MAPYQTVAVYHSICDPLGIGYTLPQDSALMGPGLYRGATSSVHPNFGVWYRDDPEDLLRQAQLQYGGLFRQLHINLAGIRDLDALEMALMTVTGDIEGHIDGIRTRIEQTDRLIHQSDELLAKLGRK